MPVPVAAVDLDRLPPASEDNVRLPWQFFRMKAEAEAKAVEYAADY